MVSILAHPDSILLGHLVSGELFLFSGLGKALDRPVIARTVVAYDVLQVSGEGLWAALALG